MNTDTEKQYTSMSSEDYIKNRLDDQSNWYDKKSSYNQKWYKRLKKIEVVLTISMPLIALIPLCDYYYNKLLLVSIGAIATILKLFIDIESRYELWMKYRTASELLKREKYLYLTKTSVYSNEQYPFNLLVTRVESILATEHNQWNNVVQNIPRNITRSQSSTTS